MTNATLTKTATRLNIFKKNALYQLEENINYSTGQGNCYLMLSQSRQCIGSLTKNILGDGWEASILCLPEKGYDTVSELIYSGDRETALSMLWKNRDQAYRY